MEPPIMPYTSRACYGILLQTARELPSANPTYEIGMEIIRMSMMRNFGIDYYDEAMGVVYTTIDNKTWDWGKDEMNTIWRSWRKYRKASTYTVQTLRRVDGVADQGQSNYMQDAPKWQRIVNEANRSNDRADLLLQTPERPPTPPGPWQAAVNEANHSKDRADLLLSMPKPLPSPSPPSQCDPESGDPQSGDPQSPETSGPSQEKPDNIVTRLTKEASFDGAMDMRTESPVLLSVVPPGVKAAVNVNRDLPPLPVEDNATSLNHSDTGHDSISSTLCSSTDQSVVSSRHGFRNITRDLLLTGSTPEPQHAIVNTLEPEKYNPTNFNNNREAMGKFNDGYVNSANSNSFGDERQTTWTDLYKKQGEATKTSHHLKGMVHSQSEGSLAFRSMPGAIDTSGCHPMSSKHKDIYVKPGQGVDFSLRSPTRGRPSSRTPSPVKYLDDVPEEQAFDLTPSSAKRARSPIKKMFGENGWLGRSSSMKELPIDPLRKTGLKNWGGKIKQRVEDLTDDLTKLMPNPFTHTTSPVKYLITSKFPVSLDPPTQAKLYSEIELMICATANQYLMIQRREGRMSVDSLVQIMNFWRSKNRPQVIEFQFDQQTQRDLVLYNLKTFRFYGANAENPLSLNAMMLSWKSMAKEMSVRTFCTPDSVVRKHMHDCYKILEMLGAPLVTFLAFQEIQVRALATMRDEQKRRDEMESVKFGVERRWELPVKGRSSEDKEMDAVLFEG